MVEVAQSAVATAMRAAEITITRFRPIRSATDPISGAAMATPAVAAVTVRLTRPADAWNRDASNGKRGCVA